MIKRWPHDDDDRDFSEWNNTRERQRQFETAPNTPSEEGQTLRGSVGKALHNYFAHLEGASVTDVYNLVLSEVEAPLLESVMNYVKGNQTKASELLGLNRGTLRKKLKQYDLL